MEILRSVIVGVFVCGCALPDDEEETLSTTTQELADFSNILTSLHPVGYWRLGESSGSTLYDASPNLMHGSYLNAALGKLGAVAGDRDTSVLFTGRDSYASVPDAKLLSLTRSWDGFNRTLASGTSWGTSSGGDAWNAQVTTGGLHYGVNGAQSYINETISGTFQQGITSTTLLGGDMQVRATWSVRATGGTLQPVALVAQRVDNNNFIRAELIEKTDHTLHINLIKTVNGVNTFLGTAPVRPGCTPAETPISPSVPSGTIQTYNTGDWWYLRFQFDGTKLRARAWKMDTVQPDCWAVSGTASSATVGSVAIRSANSGTGSTARPLVLFEGFWVQTLGFSAHMIVKLSTAAQANTVTYFFGKDEYGDGDNEYSCRYHQDVVKIRCYVFEPGESLGAGIEYPNPYEPTQMLTRGLWYSVVFTLDSGDALDQKAGISMYVNGMLIGSAPDPGAKYDGGSEWKLYPFSGPSPLRMGTVGKQEFLNGNLDEVAIFSRKLTQEEVTTLYNARF